MAEHFGETIERDHRRLGTTDPAEMNDQQLLERFASRREEASFATLVRRHGALVRGVCRRVLNNEHDAEDAFQATFLVLARKAPHVNWGPSVGPWLYQVANRTSRKIKTGLAKQRQRNTAAAKARPVESLDDMNWRELRQVMDEELERLPEKYRAPVVLCCLEGKSRDEAAEALGWTLNAVKSCLEAGRELLRSRLARRGLTLSISMLAMLLSQQANAAVPAAVVGTTVQAAMAFTAKSAAAGAISETARTLALAELHAMFIAKAKIIAAVASCVLFFTGTAGATAYQLLSDRPDAPPALVQTTQTQTPPQAAVIQIDLAAHRLTAITPGAGNSATTTTYALAPEVKVFVDNHKQGQLRDVPTRFTGSLALTLENQKVVEVMVVGTTLQGVLTVVTPSEQTMMIAHHASQSSIGTKDVPIRSAGKDAAPLKLEDLKPGQTVSVRMSADGERALGITVHSN